MGAALFAQHEARSQHRRFGPGLERPADVRGIGDAAGQEERIAVGQRGLRALEEVERALHAADMAAGFDALHDHGVRASRVGVPSLLDRAALVQPDAGGAAPWRAPEGDERVSLSRDLPVAASSEREQQVDRDGLPCRIASRSKLGAHRRRVEEPDRAEPAGLRDGRRQLVAGDPAAHPGLYHGQVHTEALQQPHPSSMPRAHERVEVGWP
jgi:hypothetical protein